MTLLAPWPIASCGEPPTTAPSLERHSQGDALAKFAVRFGKIYHALLGRLVGLAGLGPPRTVQESQVPQLMKTLNDLVVNLVPIAVSQFLGRAQNVVLGMFAGNLFQVGLQTGILVLVAHLLRAVVVPGRPGPNPG